MSTNTFTQYLDTLPDDRKAAMTRLRDLINKNIPKGFMETINYNMPSWVVPHTTYPDGYHCDPKLPLPFLSIASQKAGISLYHMGIYAMPDVLKWFTDEYPRHSKTKLDMGKSCIRFKKVEEIPFELIGELMKKITVKQWIERYEEVLKK